VRSLVGTRALIRLALRRDRILLPAFLVIVVGMVASGTQATIAFYPNLQSRIEAATVVNTTSSTLAMFGPIHDVTSLGAVSVFKLGMMGLIAIAILAARLVVRHTRAEEETGRLEMIGATVVGRRAPLTAALVVAGGMSIVTGGAAALGLVAAGLPREGSAILGAGFAALGLACAAIGALTAQVTMSARAAAGMATGAIGVFYLVRAIADAGPDGNLAWLSWASPIGWYQQTRPYAGNRWWPLALPLVLAVVMLVVAYAAAARRDFAAGLLADKSGRATASPSLATPLALAWRLQRGSFFIWASSFLVVGAVIGGITSSVSGFLDSPPVQDLMRRFGGVENVTDAFLSVELGMMAVVVTVYGMQAAMRLRAEETGLRAEPMLATPVTRIPWVWSHLTIALAGSAALMAIAGLSAGLTSAAQVDIPHQFWRVVEAAIIQVPAIWVVIGIGIAAFGLAPRLVIAGWVALVFFVLLGEFGPLFRLDQWLMNLSPYAHTPRMPGGHLTTGPLVWLIGIAAALIAAGLVGFRRRDLD